MKFREHRGGLDESMATCVEIADYGALLAHCRKLLDPYCGFSVNADHLSVEPYMRDERIGWDTHIVLLDGYGVLGFTDGPARAASKRTAIMCNCDTSKIYLPPWGITPSETEIVSRMSELASHVNFHHEVGCIVRYGAAPQPPATP